MLRRWFLLIGFHRPPFGYLQQLLRVRWLSLQPGFTGFGVSALSPQAKKERDPLDIDYQQTHAGASQLFQLQNPNVFEGGWTGHCGVNAATKKDRMHFCPCGRSKRHAPWQTSPSKHDLMSVVTLHKHTRARTSGCTDVTTGTDG